MNSDKLPQVMSLGSVSVGAEDYTVSMKMKNYLGNKEHTCTKLTLVTYLVQS